MPERDDGPRKAAWDAGWLSGSREAHPFDTQTVIPYGRDDLTQAWNEGWSAGFGWALSAMNGGSRSTNPYLPATPTENP